MPRGTTDQLQTSEVARSVSGQSPLVSERAGASAGGLSYVLWSIIGASLFVHVACFLASRTLLSGWRLAHHPIHAAVETAGGLIALWVAWLLRDLYYRGVGTNFNVWIAGGLVSMGVLDVMHAGMYVGEQFVWLHSLATMLGGLLFSAVWLPQRWQRQVASWWPWSVAAASLALGILSILCPAIVPPMLTKSASGIPLFSVWARALNIVGGLFFFLASWRLVKSWRATGNTDDLLFCLHCGLFGAAAVMFEQSALWDIAWWGWHLLRLMAYGVALWFVVRADCRDAQELRQQAESMAQFSAIVNSSDDAIIGLDIDGTVTSWNPAAENLYGYSSQEMIGQQIRRILPPDYSDELSGVLMKLKHGRAIDHVESVHACKDGSQVDVSVTVSPIRDASGRVTGASMIVRDITQRLRVVRELEQQALLIRSLMESTGEGIYGLDVHGNCTWANPAAARLLGYGSPAEFLGLHMYSLIHHSHEDGTPYPSELCQIYRAFRKGEGVHVDTEVLWRKDGSSFAAEYWSYPVEVDGKVVGSVVTFTDITERRQLEEAQRNLNALLESRVAKRTEDLAKANDALEQSNIDLQQFAYSASHDLQTPLRAIAGYAQFLEEEYAEKLDNKASEYIERIVAGTERMQQLITDLLEYSRVESRAAPFQQVSLNEIFDDVLTLLQSSIEETGATVTRDQLPRVYGDRSQLTQLLQNLIGNALKYHSDVPPRIHVCAERPTAKSVGASANPETQSIARDVLWQIAVRDNGIGIAPEHHKKIFEIFRRLHTSQAYPGTGIGLAICQRIVRRHGGNIWLKSKPGCGSTFYFTVRGCSADAVSENQPDPTGHNT